MTLYLARQYEGVPPVADPFWSGQTAGLLAFVTAAEAVTIDGIVAWGEMNGHTGPMIRHMLAWLSFKDLVHYEAGPEVWTLGPTPTVTYQSLNPLETRKEEEM